LLQGSQYAPLPAIHGCGDLNHSSPAESENNSTTVFSQGG
jgi:hypothetical protein